MAVFSMSGAVMAQRSMSLQELFDLADVECRQVQVSRTAQQVADAQLQSARASRLPDVSLSLSGSYIGNATLMDRRFSTHGTADLYYAIAPYVGQARLGKQDTPHWGNQFAFQASQVLYAGGAISAGIRLAELGTQLAALDVEQQRQEVRFLLTGYYLDLYKLDNQRRVIQKNIELADSLLCNMHHRLEQGTVLANDITRFELLTENLRLALAQVEDAAAIVNHQLSTTLHTDCRIVPTVSTEEQLYADGSEALGSTEQYWQAQASDHHIGLRQATLAGQMAREQLQIVRSDNRPKVALVAEDHLGGPYTSDLIPADVNTNAWFVGVGIKYNLGSLWRNRHEVRRAQLEVTRRAEQLEVAREGVDNGVQASYVSFLTCQTELRTQQKSVQLADQNYDVVRNRYAEGLALLTDMLDASNMKLSADMALVDARIHLIYQYYKLKYVVNGL